jgi:CBS domain-containing protein
MAFVALRRRQLYEAQPATRRDSPIHRTGTPLEGLPAVRVRDVVAASRPFRVFEPRTSTREIVTAVAEAGWQTTFPVLQGARLQGLLTAGQVQALRTEDDLHTLTIAADLMQAPVAVRPDDDLRAAAAVMLTSGLKQVPVLAEDGAITGFLEEVDVTRAYVAAMGAAASGQR